MFFLPCLAFVGSGELCLMAFHAIGILMTHGAHIGLLLRRSLVALEPVLLVRYGCPVATHTIIAFVAEITHSKVSSRSCAVGFR